MGVRFWSVAAGVMGVLALGVAACAFVLVQLFRERRDEARDRGASAVEIALIAPFLVTLAVGTIDFSTYFLRSQSATDAVRNGARQAALGTAGRDCTTGNQAEKVACVTRKGTRPGTAAWVRGYTVVGGSVIPDRWMADRVNDVYGTVIICAIVPVDGATGLTPMPHNAHVYKAAQASVFIDSGTVAPHQDPAPAGTDWDWCDKLDD